jgi:hypothetical protein
MPFKAHSKAFERSPQASEDPLGNLYRGKNEFKKIKNQTAAVDQGKNELFKLKSKLLQLTRGKTNFFN